MKCALNCMVLAAFACTFVIGGCKSSTKSSSPTASAQSPTVPAASSVVPFPVASAALPSASVAWTPPLAVPPVVTPSKLPGYSNVMLPKLGVQIEVLEMLAAKQGPDLISTANGASSISFTELPPDKNIDELFAEATTDDPQSPRSIVYKKKKEGWFVVSGYVGKAIYYDKTVRLGARNFRFSLSYPVKQKAEYQADTDYMANSFRLAGTPAPRPPKGLCRNSGDCSEGYGCTPTGFCTRIEIAPD